MGEREGGREGYTSVPVRRGTKEVLEELRRQLGVGSWDQLLLLLVKEFEACRGERLRRRVRDVMCYEMRSSRAAISAWVSVLTRQYGFSAEELKVAMDFLRYDPKDGVFYVDTSRC